MVSENREGSCQGDRLVGLSTSKSKRIDHGLIVLVALSAVVTTFWLFTQPLGYTSDSTTYIQLADYLVNKRPADSFLFFRTPGYPIVLLLGGVPWTGSFIGPLVIQALMAVAIPGIFYCTVKLYCPRAAFPVTTLLIATLVPFAYSKAIMPDHAFIFSLMLLFFLIALYDRRRRPILVYTIACVAIFSAALRPSANFIGYILLIGVLVIETRQYRHVIAALALVFVASATWSIWVALHVMPGSSINLNDKSTDRVVLSAFYTIYSMNTADATYIDPANGPSSDTMHRYLKDFVDVYESAWADRLPASRFGAYAGRHDDFVRQLYTRPSPMYFDLIVFALRTINGIQRGDVPAKALLIGAVEEAVEAHPSLLLTLARTFLMSASTSFAGQQLFYDTYVAAASAVPEIGGDATENARSSGPAFEEMIATVREFTRDYPQFWETREPADIFADFVGRPDALINDSLLKHPNIHTFWFIWNVVDFMNGPIISAELFRSAAFENIKSNPSALLIIWDNFVTFFVGPVATYNAGHRVIGLSTVRMPRFADPALAAPLRAEVASGLKFTKDDRFTFPIFDNETIAMLIGFIYTAIKVIAVLLTIITFGALWNSRTLWFGVIVSIFLLYHGIVVATFAEPISRYVFQVFPTILLLASLTVSAAVGLVRSFQVRPHVVPEQPTGQNRAIRIPERQSAIIACGGDRCE